MNVTDYNADYNAVQISTPVAPAALGSPIPTHPSGVVCRSCGTANEAGSSLCSKPTCRKVLKGNALAKTTGLYASLTPELRAFEAAGEALVEQSLIDAGGREELGAREVSDHEYRGVLHVRILKLAHALNAMGEFDRRGRLRKGWIELLDRLISSAVAIDKTLGLPRKARPVASARDIIAEYRQREARDE